MHFCIKVPRHASKNPIAAGNFKWIFACNCEDTEQLQAVYKINDRGQKNEKSIVKIKRRGTGWSE